MIRRGRQGLTRPSRRFNAQYKVLKRMQSILLRHLDDTVVRCTGPRASWRVSKQRVFSPNDKRLDRPLAALAALGRSQSGSQYGLDRCKRQGKHHW